MAMERTAAELAQALVDRLKTTPPSARLIVGLAGIPASGKSTLARLVVEKYEEMMAEVMSPARVCGEPNDDDNNGHEPEPEPGNKMVLINMDGWHFTRAQLDRFPDPALAHARRGSHWTFDADAYAAFIRRLREEPLTASTAAVYAPTFDHALKDPCPDAVAVTRAHRVVLVEGLYTLLAIEPWRGAALLLDERWLLLVDEEEAQRRLVERHVESGIARDWEEATRRAQENDVPNGEFILEHSLDATRYIRSVDDTSL